MNQATREMYQRSKEFEQKVFSEFGGALDTADTKARIELAQRDLEDIVALRATPAFERYFMRRIGMKRDELENELKHAQVTPEQREVIRQKYLQLEAIGSLLKVDEANCRRVLSPDRPMLSGPGGVPE